MMGSLLDHLIEITGHRDHDLLDVSVMTALLDMIGIRRARVMELFQSRGDLMIRPRVWIVDGKVKTVNDHTNIELVGEPIIDYPCLVACIAQRKTSLEEQRPDGQRFVDSDLAKRQSVDLPRGSSRNVAYSADDASHGRHTQRLS